MKQRANFQEVIFRKRKMEKINQNMSAQVGTRVIHKKYGVGTIVNRHKKKINIQFDSGIKSAKKCS